MVGLALPLNLMGTFDLGALALPGLAEHRQQHDPPVSRVKFPALAIIKGLVLYLSHRGRRVRTGPYRVAHEATRRSRPVRRGSNSASRAAIALRSPGSVDRLSANPAPTLVSHVGRRRCCRDVDVVGHVGNAPPAARPASLSFGGHGAAAGLAGRKDGVAVSTPARRGAVRADLEQVFRTAYPQVVAVAARVLGSRDEAEDVAQEVFLTFGRSSVPAGEASGWLSVAAAHTALNHLRSGRRRAAREEAAGDGATVCPDVADAVVTLDERRHVRAALARLSRRQAIALVLRHSGLSYAEVAAALDLSPGSVGTIVRRAESALRKELNRDASSE